MLVHAIRFHLESCYALIKIANKNAIRKFSKNVFSITFFSVLTVPISKQNHRPISLMVTYWHWDLTETHHLLLDTLMVSVVLKPKSLIIKLENGIKQLTIRLPTIGTQQKNKKIWIIFQNIPLRYDFNRRKRIYHRWVHRRGSRLLQIYNCRIQRRQLETRWWLVSSSSWTWRYHNCWVYYNGCWWWRGYWRTVSPYNIRYIIYHILSIQHIWSREGFTFIFTFSSNTELWEMDSFEYQIINPILLYYDAPGLFLVDVGYCSENWKE